jgi:anti-sigma factor RsiW
MPECPYDLRDYLLDELTPRERAEVERHLESSSEARQELERLRLTHTALQRLPDEEIPRRVAFVSDKVFEPSPAMRFWREFWTAAPRAAFGMAAVLLVLFGGMWLTQPAVTVDEAGWRVAFGAASPAPSPVPAPAGLTAEQAEQVREVVFQAIAEREQQQRVMLANMLSEQRPRPAVSAAEVAQVRREVQEMRSDLGDSYTLIRRDIEKLFDTVGERSTLAVLGR